MSWWPLRSSAHGSKLRRAGRYWPALALLAGLTCPLILSTWYTFNKQRAALENAYHLELEQMTTVLANGMREPIGTSRRCSAARSWTR